MEQPSTASSLDTRLDAQDARADEDSGSTPPRGSFARFLEDTPADEAFRRHSYLLLERALARLERSGDEA